MSPTVAAASAPLHRSSNPSADGNKNSSSPKPSKSGNGETRLARWKNPAAKSAPSRTSAVTSSVPNRPSSVASDTRTKKKKKKRFSPFRIKAGCVVALRYRATGNHVALISPDGVKMETLNDSSQSYAEVWADPMPGRDEGLALIGRRIRCCFPKSVLSGKLPASSRIIEGEIVSLVDYETQWRLQRKSRRQRDPCSIIVELLVERVSLSVMPFLKRTDEPFSSEKVSEAEKKRRRYEEIIRGENKVMVQVTLADTGRIAKTESARTHESNDEPVARWVIRKRVPLALGGAPYGKTTNGEGENDSTLGETNGTAPGGGKGHTEGKTQRETNLKDKPAKRRKKQSGKNASLASATRYVGNGNDSPAQQERNWRWAAGRYADLRLTHGLLGNFRLSDVVSLGLVGEVLRVTPTTTKDSATTLATVTIRRLILPEHTCRGRMTHHGPSSLFEDYDSSADFCGEENGKGSKMNGNDTFSTVSNQNFCVFQVPVEELVIISRRFERMLGDASEDEVGRLPMIVQSYSFRMDAFLPVGSSGANELSTASDELDLTICHRCRQATPSSEMKTCMLNSCDTGPVDAIESNPQKNWWCANCLSFLERFGAYASLNEKKLALCCDCRGCTTVCGALAEDQFAKAAQEAANVSQAVAVSLPERHEFASACAATQAMYQVNFHLSKVFLGFSSLPISSDMPLSRVKKRAYKKRKRNGVSSYSARAAADAARNKKTQKEPSKTFTGTNNPSNESRSNLSDGESDFEPSCSRLLPYDPKKKRFSGVPKQQVTRNGDEGLSGEKTLQRRIAARGAVVRQNNRSRGKTPDRTEKKTTNRAARANQRRMMKDVAAFGATGLSLDALAGREQQLRFDKSLIHAWGVFADEEIKNGEMIVEYRGELIGNAVAEKREKEYEDAKIGSDYMFRIDSYTVCDATKQGNVARFINASCSPNCYTQIITLNGVKRIVIYAKRDIQAGEELCYDYKFPLEFDETRRIKCYCGAPDCRGFMNWDKRYVALPAPQGGKPTSSHRLQ